MGLSCFRFILCIDITSMFSKSFSDHFLCLSYIMQWTFLTANQVDHILGGAINVNFQFCSCILDSLPLPYVWTDTTFVVFLHSMWLSYGSGTSLWGNFWSDDFVFNMLWPLILMKIHFSWKLITGSEKMEPFDVLNMVIFSFGAAFQAKYQKIHTFLTISQDSVHIFKNQFLRWNRGFKPVVLSTITPIIGRISYL